MEMKEKSHFFPAEEANHRRTELFLSGLVRGLFFWEEGID